MSMKLASILFSIVVCSICVTVSGCTRRVLLTQPLRERFELGMATPEPGTEAALGGPPSRPVGELQYFLSQRIVLEREASSRHDRLAQGRIVVRNGRLVERVIIRRGTPGVAVDWGPDWIAVSFEAGTRLVFDLVDDAALGPGIDHAPAGPDEQKLPRTSYRLRTTALPDRPPTVTFDGAQYEPGPGAREARLLVPRNAWTSNRVHRRVLHGRRVEE
jgi:hypothetical protein